MWCAVCATRITGSVFPLLQIHTIHITPQFRNTSPNMRQSVPFSAKPRNSPHIKHFISDLRSVSDDRIIAGECELFLH